MESEYSRVLICVSFSACVIIKTRSHHTSLKIVDWVFETKSTNLRAHKNWLALHFDVIVHGVYTLQGTRRICRLVLASRELRTVNAAQSWERELLSVWSIVDDWLCRLGWQQQVGYIFGTWVKNFPLFAIWSQHPPVSSRSRSQNPAMKFAASAVQVSLVQSTRIYIPGPWIPWISSLYMLAPHQRWLWRCRTTG